MTNATYTPGPWGIDMLNDGYKTRVRSKNKGHIASAIISTSEKFPLPAKEAEANARLIAASPEYHAATAAILDAIINNAAPVNPMAALKELAADKRHITLNAGLLLALMQAHMKAEGK